MANFLDLDKICLGFFDDDSKSFNFSFVLSLINPSLPKVYIMHLIPVIAGDKVQILLENSESLVSHEYDYLNFTGQSER